MIGLGSNKNKNWQLGKDFKGKWIFFITFFFIFMLRVINPESFDDLLTTKVHHEESALFSHPPSWLTILSKKSLRLPHLLLRLDDRWLDATWRRCRDDQGWHQAKQCQQWQAWRPLRFGSHWLFVVKVRICRAFFPGVQSTTVALLDWRQLVSYLQLMSSANKCFRKTKWWNTINEYWASND